MNPEQIFNQYTSKENVPFYLLSKGITFPLDNELDISQWIFNSENKPWTILSYEIYGTIEYWWVLVSLNPQNSFYAPENSEIKFIRKDIIGEVLGNVNI